MSTVGTSGSIRDQWAQWVLERQYGGDLSQKWSLDRPHPARDAVLRNAQITEGDVLLDVGCGDGLVACAALAQAGEQGRVIFSDVSQDLLDQCRATAEVMSAQDRCAFVRAPADDLAAIGDASVGVVTPHSVLIYVAAKERAFREFLRVLTPGGVDRAIGCADAGSRTMSGRTQ